MKVFNKLLLTFLFTTIFTITSNAQSNIVFSVNTSPNLNLGLKVKNFVFIVGADFSYASNKTKTEILNQVSENEYSVYNINPGFGIKYYLYESDFSPFLSGNIHKQIPVSVDVKGDINSKKDIEDRYDDFTFQIGGGGDFSIKESLLIGFELGLHIRPSTNNTSLSENESNYISTFSNVTLTYIFN